MAHQEQNLPPLTPQRDSGSINKQETTSVQNIPATGGRRGGPVNRSPWQERAVNASAHEVPSGPNPISNR